MQVNLLEALLMCAYYAIFVAYIAIFDSSRSTPLNIADSHHYQEVLRSTSSQEMDNSPVSYPIAPSPLGLASRHALPERAEAVQALGAHARRASSLSGGFGPSVDPGSPAVSSAVEVRNITSLVHSLTSRQFSQLSSQTNFRSPDVVPYWL